MKVYAKILGVLLVALAIQLTLAAGEKDVGDSLVSRAFTVVSNINSLVSRAFTVTGNTDSLVSRAFTVSSNTDSLVSRAFTVSSNTDSLVSRAFTYVNCGECPTDADFNGETGPLDLAILLGNWGPVTPPGSTCLDADGDDDLGPFDLAFLLGHWGPCP